MPYINWRDKADNSIKIYFLKEFENDLSGIYGNGIVINVFTNRPKNQDV